MLAAHPLTPDGAGLADQRATKVEACHTALAGAKFDQAAPAREHLGRPLAAVFARHRVLHATNNVGQTHPMEWFAGAPKVSERP